MAHGLSAQRLLHSKGSLLSLWEQRAGQRPEPPSLSQTLRSNRKLRPRGQLAYVTQVHSQGATQLPLAGLPWDFLGPGLPASSPFLHFEGSLSSKLKPHEPFPSPSGQLCPISSEHPVPPAAAEDQDGGLTLSVGPSSGESCDFGVVISPL